MAHRQRPEAGAPVVARGAAAAAGPAPVQPQGPAGQPEFPEPAPPRQQGNLGAEFKRLTATVTQPMIDVCGGLVLARRLMHARVQGSDTDRLGFSWSPWTP